MGQSFSIAKAKALLPRLVHEAEAGTPVEITRRGRPVAMIVSIDVYERMSVKRGTFWDDLDSFRVRHGLHEDGAKASEWPAASRADAEPRDFEW